jgi:hypothetical protein
LFHPKLYLDNKGSGKACSQEGHHGLRMAIVIECSVDAEQDQHAKENAYLKYLPQDH